MTEVDDGWVELPAVYDPIVRTRFVKKTLLRMRGTESESRVAGAEHIWCPTRFPFSCQSASTRFEVLPDASLRSPQVTVSQRRSLHRGWLKEYLMNSSADIASATTLYDIELKRFALGLYRQHRSQNFEKEWRGRTSGRWTSPM